MACYVRHVIVIGDALRGIRRHIMNAVGDVYVDIKFLDGWVARSDVMDVLLPWMAF